MIAHDAYLYEPDAILVGLLLFHGRVCTACGEELPGCTDYFTLNTNGSGEPSLLTICKRCRRAKLRDGERVRAARRRAARKVAS